MALEETSNEHPTRKKKVVDEKRKVTGKETIQYKTYDASVGFKQMTLKSKQINTEKQNTQALLRDIPLKKGTMRR